MIEHKFPFESFIGGWYMDESICDDLINFYRSTVFYNKKSESHLSQIFDKEKKILILIQCCRCRSPPLGAR